MQEKMQDEERREEERQQRLNEMLRRRETEKAKALFEALGWAPKPPPMKRRM
jgi:hypothetical protein